MMRKALDQPAMLFEWFEADGDLMAEGLGESRLPGAERVWVGRGEGGLGVVSVWPDGRSALEVRARSVLGPGWAGIAGRLASQPRVHLVAMHGLAWPELPPQRPVRVIFVTVDAESIVPHEGPRAPRTLLNREHLPGIEGASIWPVVGHPGRLMVWGEGLDEAAVCAALTESWGPLAQAPAVFTLG